MELDTLKAIAKSRAEIALLLQPLPKEVFLEGPTPTAKAPWAERIAIALVAAVTAGTGTYVAKPKETVVVEKPAPALTQKIEYEEWDPQAKAWVKTTKEPRP